MRLHHEFEWDKAKAEANRRKHRVTFDDAQAVLGDDEGDRFHHEEYDDEHSNDEDRLRTYGSHPDDRRIVLIISWTERRVAGRRVTRIISARLARPQEKKKYGKAIGGR